MVTPFVEVSPNPDLCNPAAAQVLCGYFKVIREAISQVLHVSHNVLRIRAKFSTSITFHPKVTIQKLQRFDCDFLNF